MTSFAKTFEKVLEDTQKTLLVLLAMGSEDDDVSSEEHDYFYTMYDEIRTIYIIIKKYNKD